jgi:hypothetical protein
LDRAVVVVVEGGTLASFVTGSITMIIIGVFLNVVGLGVFSWALFALAIHAVPFFVGMTVGIYSFKPEQVRSVPSSLASLRPASHAWSGSTPSPSRVRPLSAFSFGCCSRFRRLAPTSLSTLDSDHAKLDLAAVITRFCLLRLAKLE